MSCRMIDHIINNLNYYFDDFIKSKIKEYYVPKYIDINTEIYEEYINLIPRRISTISLPKVLRGLVSHYRALGNDDVRQSSVFAVSMAYLQSIGEHQGLDRFDFDYAKKRGGVVGMNLGRTFNYTTIRNVIYDLVGNKWENIIIEEN
jgi:hypothetical protein